MYVIPLHHSNFNQIRKIWEKSQRDFKTGVYGRILFNQTQGRFEYYEPHESKSHSKTDKYSNVIEAIETYEKDHKMREALLASVGQTLDENNATTLNEPPVDRLEDFDDGGPYNEPNYVEEETDAPHFPDIDDPELMESTNHNLSVLKDIKDKENTQIRERLLKVVSDIYGYDMITESDIAMAIVESGELKKLLSMLYGKIGLRVSSTQVSSDLKVTSGELQFIPKIEYRLEDYRRGAAQCLVEFERLAEVKNQLDDKDRQIREATRDLQEERRKGIELTAAMEKLRQERDAVREIKPLVPTEFVIAYPSEKGLRYVMPTKDRKLDDGTFPTKYLGSTSQRSKAYVFTLETAQAQVARIIKHKGNVTFTSIADKGSKELAEFFSIHRTLVEKVEVQKSESRI